MDNFRIGLRRIGRLIAPTRIARQSNHPNLLVNLYTSKGFGCVQSFAAIASVNLPATPFRLRLHAEDAEGAW